MIERERERTLGMLGKTTDIYQINSKFYKETILRAQRAYTGQQMRAVYTDSGKGQFFNVENLALKYYG